VGSLVAYLLGTAIPNQRIERIALFVSNLGKAVALQGLEIKKLEDLLTNSEFAQSLAREAILQAADAPSDDRRRQIACLLARGLSHNQIETDRAEHLLRLLSELTDAEVIFLRSHYGRGTEEAHDFYAKHEDLLRPASRRPSLPQHLRDRATIQASYKAHLARLGLLQDEGDHLSYQLTQLGLLLLRTIGVVEDT
jgi:hypothetical protein